MSYDAFRDEWIEKNNENVCLVQALWENYNEKLNALCLDLRTDMKAANFSELDTDLCVASLVDGIES